jgi:hypothetical protein
MLVADAVAAAAFPYCLSFVEYSGESKPIRHVFLADLVQQDNVGGGD